MIMASTIVPIPSKPSPTVLPIKNRVDALEDDRELVRREDLVEVELADVTT